MKKNPNTKTTGGLTGRALQLLALHSNVHGEISSGLEAALLLAGPKASVTAIPTTTLAAHGLEGSALLIRGKKNIVWLANAPLGTVAELAKAYGANLAANWIAHLEVERIAPATKPSGRFRPLPCPATAASLLTILAALATAHPAFASNVGGQEKPFALKSLIVNNAACGEDVLAVLDAAAEKAGFAVERGRSPARLSSDPKFNLLLPALGLTRKAEQQPEPLRVPVIASVEPDQSLTFSFYARFIQAPADENRGNITLRLRHRSGDQILAETSADLGHAWTRVSLTAGAESSTPPESLFIEITIRGESPIRITFVRAFITKNTGSAAKLQLSEEVHP